MTITDDQIQSAALAAGFTLKPQPDGGMVLHPHVFEFGRAMFATHRLDRNDGHDQTAADPEQYLQTDQNRDPFVDLGGKTKQLHSLGATATGVVRQERPGQAKSGQARVGQARLVKIDLPLETRLSDRRRVSP